jgi:hypothetical protein
MSRFPQLATAKLKRGGLILLALTIAGGLLVSLLMNASGERLGARSLQLSNNEISTTTDYQLSFDFVSVGTVGSIRVEFCSNDPLPATPCVAPNGFDASGVTLIDQDGPGDFTVASGAAANEIILTHTPSVVGVSTARFHFTGVKNPSDAGPYFARLQTFASTDATGSFSDYGGIAFIISDSPSVTAEVPPYLIFCSAVTINGLDCTNINGDFIDFGALSSKKASSGTSQLLVATNAVDGYNVTYGGTTLTSGNNIINALAASDVSRPGIGQFGFNLRANASPAIGQDPVGPGLSSPQPNYDQSNTFLFSPGDIILQFPQPDDVRKYTASYIANVSNNQAAGIYVSTITYVCLANF